MSSWLQPRCRATVGKPEVGPAAVGAGAIVTPRRARKRHFVAGPLPRLAGSVSGSGGEFQRRRCHGLGRRFDGYRFVNFGVADGLPHRRVTALLETRAGEYLVGPRAAFAASGRKAAENLQHRKGAVGLEPQTDTNDAAVSQDYRDASAIIAQCDISLAPFSRTPFVARSAGGHSGG